VKEPIRMLAMLKTTGALALVDDRLRHRSGSLLRDVSQEKKVSEHMWDAE
jgi:hypothetical protein